MILAVDTGNTSVSLGIVSDKKILKVWHIDALQSALKLKSNLRSVLSNAKKRFSIEDVIICSVVPKTLNVIRNSNTQRLIY